MDSKDTKRPETKGATPSTTPGHWWRKLFMKLISAVRAACSPKRRQTALFITKVLKRKDLLNFPNGRHIIGEVIGVELSNGVKGEVRLPIYKNNRSCQVAIDSFYSGPRVVVPLNAATRRLLEPFISSAREESPMGSKTVGDAGKLDKQEGGAMGYPKAAPDLSTQSGKPPSSTSVQSDSPSEK